MSASKPVARTKADQPAATRHLSSGEVESMEMSGEAEHETGERREQFTDAAAQPEKHSAPDSGKTRKSAG